MFVTLNCTVNNTNLENVNIILKNIFIYVILPCCTYFSAWKTNSMKVESKNRFVDLSVCAFTSWDFNIFQASKVLSAVDYELPGAHLTWLVSDPAAQMTNFCREVLTEWIIWSFQIQKLFNIFRFPNAQLLCMLVVQKPNWKTELK